MTDFIALRPYLYHLTARANLPLIRKVGQLESAERLLTRGGLKHLIAERRPESLKVPVDGAIIMVRDQRPLYKGNINFEDGWKFQDLIRHLNQHIFFWPGTTEKVINYGIRHFERYEQEAPVILRVSTSEIIGANPGSPLLFCPYNSGSPRCVGGKRSPRGANTFQPCHTAPYTPGKVVEVVVQGVATLPQFEVGKFRSGKWEPEQSSAA